MALANLAGAPLYVVHISAGAAVQALAAARAQGQPVVGETSISYLALTDEVYDVDGFEPARYVCSPPIRDRINQDQLWLALQNGGLQVVGSDHDPFNLADRRRLGGESFAKIPNGIAGIEQIRPLLWSDGVVAGRLSLERFVAVTATNPARTFGLWPRKGAITVGSDADLVVWDPHKEVVLGLDTTHSAADYCVYEGRKVCGYPVVTVSRGEVVYRDGIIAARPGRGRFLQRGEPLPV
jgi:dihydropyrimidinase